MPIPPPTSCRSVRRLFLVSLVWFLALGLGAAMAADPKPESGGLQVLQGEPTPLTFWNREVAILRADIDGISPAERVKRIKDKIDFILATKPGTRHRRSRGPLPISPATGSRSTGFRPLEWCPRMRMA